MNVSEKVAYIKGLAEGLSVDDKVVNAILDVLGDIAKEIASLKETTEYLESYIEEGSQKIGEGIYGKSITDACIGWDTTERLVLDIADLI